MIPLIPLKQSKTPKSRQKSSHSKFKRMKQRLQYKFPHVEEAAEDQPLWSVPPLEGVMPLASEPPSREECAQAEERR